MRQNRQANWPQTWEEIFAGLPTATGSEVEQQRHKELREQGEMTEAEEGELNVLFYVISPQLTPETRQTNMLDSCWCCPGSHGDGLCGYHANKTRRFKQRLSSLYRTSKRSSDRRDQPNSLDEHMTFSDIFYGLAECFCLPVVVIWFTFLSSASVAASILYWMVVVLITVMASVALWSE